MAAATARQTSVPGVWACGDLQDDEVLPTRGQLTHAANYFAKHGATAAFLTPKELNYELPSEEVPEIALAGRSNVGKSTLITALLGRGSGLVRTSKTPGCTTTLNLYRLGSSSRSSREPPTFIVDLPGYGFAKRSKTVQKAFGDVMANYLQTRGFLTLRRTFVLIDARRGPQAVDWELMEMLQLSTVMFQLVLTKADLVSELEQTARAAQLFDGLTKRKHNTHMPIIYAVSSKTGQNIDQLRYALAAAAGFV